MSAPQAPQQQQQIKMDVESTKQASSSSRVLVIVGSTALYLVTMAAVFGLCFAAVQLSKDMRVSEDDLLVSNKDQVPLRFSEALKFVPLEGFAFLPLAEMQKMASLHIMIGKDGERVYNIEAVFRDRKTNTTEAHLSLGHKLVSAPGKFSLIDEKGEVVYAGEYEYEITTLDNAVKIHKEGAVEEKGSNRRRLIVSKIINKIHSILGGGYYGGGYYGGGYGPGGYGGPGYGYGRGYGGPRYGYPGGYGYPYGGW